jgi:hypothetical protein
MMTALLLYSYCCGIYSSRRIAKACRERVDFMSIVGFDVPDFRTISEFRRRHLKALKALEALFSQILQLCEAAGLVKPWACCARWHQDQSQRLQAQGDELRAHGEARRGAGSRGCQVVCGGRFDRCRGG